LLDRTVPRYPRAERFEERLEGGDRLGLELTGQQIQLDLSQFFAGDALVGRSE
jgi:hypothetical protein